MAKIENQSAELTITKLRTANLHAIKRLLTAGASLLIGLSAAACGSNSTTTTSSSASAVSAPTTTQAPTTATTQAPKTAQWVTVVRASGHSDKRTDLFTLHGGRAKLTYSFTDDAGMGLIVAAIYVLKEGESLKKSGGAPEALISQPGKNSTFLAKAAGRYYLEVSAAYTHWTVTIRERR